MPSIHPFRFGLDARVTKQGGLPHQPRLSPIIPETGTGVARPFTLGMNQIVTMLGGLAQPLYPRADLTEGPRAALVATGSATSGGELIKATIVPNSGPLELELGSDEVNQIFVCDIGPRLQGGVLQTGQRLDVVPAVRGISLGGRGFDATAQLVASLSVDGTTIYLGLGLGQTPLGTYRVTLRVTVYRLLQWKARRVERILFPDIECPS